MAKLTKPHRLGPGSRVAIVAPSGPPKPERLNKGLQFLRAHGYIPKVYSQVKRRMGYLAGDDEARAQALMDAFRDDAIDGIIAARGGYGSLRLLPYLDFDVISDNPKPLVGYSDLTVLLLAIYKKCHLVTFHGPMPAVEFGRPIRNYTAEHYFKALEIPMPMGRIKHPPDHRFGGINKGAAEGRIVGGNLSLMARMVGTGLLPVFKDKIVFLEDTEEEPYRLDAYFAQLFLSTDIDEAAGFLIGEFTRTETRYGHSQGWTAIEVVKNYFSRLNQPLVYNFPCGHGQEKITIPIGTRVMIDSEEKTVEFLEAGVK